MIKNKLGIVVVVNMTLSSVKLILVDNASSPVEFKKIQSIFNEESQNWEFLKQILVFQVAISCG